MKYLSYFLTFSIIIIATSFGVAQKAKKKRNKEEVMKKLGLMKEIFSSSSNDSLFVKNNGDNRYEKIELEDHHIADQAWKELLFSSGPQTVVGPYEQESSGVLYKIIDFTVRPMVKVKQLSIAPEGSSLKDSAKTKAQAEKILKYPADFTIVNQLVKAGRTEGWEAPLWFGKGDMVKPFEEACFQAKKGDRFVVQTSYGAHVVEVLEGPVMRRSSVILIPLILNY